MCLFVCMHRCCKTGRVSPSPTVSPATMKVTSKVRPGTLTRAPRVNAIPMWRAAPPSRAPKTLFATEDPLFMRYRCTAT